MSARYATSAIDVPFLDAASAGVGTTIAKQERMEIDDREMRSIAEVVSDLKDDLTELVKEEVSLARVELAEKARRARRGALSFALGGVLAFAGFLALIQQFCSWISWNRNMWLSSAIVGVGLFAIGALIPGRGAQTL